MFLAGLEPWPKLFHNLRSSRETELTQGHPIQVVTAWLGNTPRIALKHYLQVTDADFEKAIKGGESAVQNPGQYAPKLGGKGGDKKPQDPVFPEKNEALHWCTSVQVDRAGIEPATPGFSVPCSTN